jgi:hypothetical protein
VILEHLLSPFANVFATNNEKQKQKKQESENPTAETPD